MGKTVTNISIVLGLVTVAFAGYYLYLQKDATTLNIEENNQMVQNMINRAQQHMQYRQVLEKVEFNTALFEDDRFLSLRSFTKPIKEQPVGRPDPFAEVEGLNTN